MLTTWNSSDKSANITLSNANLTATSTGTSAGLRAVDGSSAGQGYWEYTLTTWTGSASNGVGFATGAASLSSGVNQTGACGIVESGSIYANATNTGIAITGITNGSVICVALDCTGQHVWFRLGAGGNWNNNASYSPGGTGGIALPWAGTILKPFAFAVVTGQVVTANFGASSFVGAVPAGYASGVPSATGQHAYAMMLA